MKSAWFVAALLALAGCGGPSGPLSITPRYTPTSKLDVGGATQMKQISFQLVDARSKGDLVGENTEQSPPIPVKARPAEVTKWLSEGLARELSVAGFEIVPQAPVGLAVTVLEVWVNEGSTYKGTVHLKVDVMKDGKTTDTLSVVGTSKHWGSSLSEENYNETLSDCVVNAVQELLRSPSLKSALSASPTPAPPAAAATVPSVSSAPAPAGP